MVNFGSMFYSGLWTNGEEETEEYSLSRQQERYPAHPHAPTPRHDEYGSLDPAAAWGSNNKRKKAHSFHEGYLRRHDTSGGESATAGSASSSSITAGSREENIPSLTAAFRSHENRQILLNCLCYLTIYYIVAVIAYSHVFERWTVIDSLYFATNTFTTCGYGNLEPTTAGGQLFTIFFTVYGVIILGVFIGIFGNFISETQARATRKLRTEHEAQILETLFTTERHIINNNNNNDASASTLLLPETGVWSDHVSLMDDVWRVVQRQFPMIAVVTILALILGIRENWSFTNTLYFSIMAATTTGFGEYTPRTQIDKLYSMFFLPLAVAVFGEVLGRIAAVFLQRKQRVAEAKFLHRTLTLCDLRNMDTDDDGAVDREEFVLFMLQALQKVDRATVQKLRDIFDSLDRNGNGLLQSDDLIEIRQSNYLPALEQVQEAVANSGLFELQEKPQAVAHHRRNFTSP